MRGFTLAEVMAVLAVISVLAAVATPSFVEMMRDRRTAGDTGTYLDAFRTARARALGRGAAVRLRITAGPIPVVSVEEHITDPNANGLADDATSQPVPGCNARGIWRRVDVYTTKNTTQLAVFSHLDNSSQASVDVCYSPRGKTMVDYPGGVTTMMELQAPLLLTTQRGSLEGSPDGRVRQIFALPNGLTRMSL